MENIMKEMNGNTPELNMERMENAAGGTPMSIPGGKRSGQKNSETALEILKGLGLKEKPINNSIYDSRLPEDWINS